MHRGSELKMYQEVFVGIATIKLMGVESIPLTIVNEERMNSLRGVDSTCGDWIDC